MQLILTETIDNLGKGGQVVNVKDGYGRNYLIPKGLAVAATSRNIRQMDHHKRIIAVKEAKRALENQTLKEKLEAASITITKQTSTEEKLFGSVTTREIAEEIKKETGVSIDKKMIQLDQPIKALGVYTVPLRLTSEINANLKIWVVAK